MPRRTAEHWKAQEQRFLDAARRCFTRLGVDSASMEELRREAGVSAGAMYRYFPSKDELVHAAIATSMVEVEELTAKLGQRDEATSATVYLRVLLASLAKFRFHIEGVDLFRLAIQGWAYSQSRPQTRAMLQDSITRQLMSYRKAAESWTSRAQAPAVAQAMAGAVLGYVVQSVFAETEIDPSAYCAGLALLQ